MNKCERTDGHLEACDELKSSSCIVTNRGVSSCTYNHDKGIFFKLCPFCGADIRKPEPEVVIKRSGGTWVYRHNGIDGIVLKPKYDDSNDMMPIQNITELINIALGVKASPMKNKYIREEYIKPISVITITDEIAKLRPMVVGIRTKRLFTLWGVDEDGILIFNDGRFDPAGIRLATVADLEASDE